MRPLILVLVLLAQGDKAPLAAEDKKTLKTPAEVKAALNSVIAKHYPKAEVTLTDDAFAAKANTMQFTIHRTLRDGSFNEKTYETDGPKHNGFMITVSLSKGRYGGPLMTPQTLREPYWSTFVNEIVNTKENTHLWVIYKHGSRVNKDFHREVLSTLGGKQPARPQAERASGRKGE